jgi:hypothetical protein
MDGDNYLLLISFHALYTAGEVYQTFDVCNRTLVAVCTCINSDTPQRLI